MNFPLVRVTKLVTKGEDRHVNVQLNIPTKFRNDVGAEFRTDTSTPPPPPTCLSLASPFLECMSPVQQVPAGATRVTDLDGITKASVLSILGQSLYAARRGNDRDALLYLGVALLAFKYKKLSFGLQAAITAQRMLRNQARRTRP